MPKLVALKRHPYESKNREPGTEYHATESDARLLVLTGQARYSDVGEAAPAPAAQAYQTRALTARRPRRSKGLAA